MQRYLLRGAAIALAVAVAFGATACGSHATPTTQRSHSGITSVAAVEVRAFSIDHLALTEHWVGFAVAPSYGASGDPAEVDVIDLRDRRRQLVARSAWKTGVTDWVEATNGWLFWTDTSQPASDSSPLAPWTIRGMQLGSGKRIMIARSGFNSPEPVPRASDGKLVWFQQTKPNTGTTAVRYFDTATQRVNTVVTLDTPPSSIGATPAGPVWDALTARGRSDVWTAPWGGGPAKRLTATGAARNVRVSSDGHFATWELGNTSQAAGLAFGDLFGGPTWALRNTNVAGGTAGNGFVAYFADGGNALGIVTAKTLANPLQLAQGVVDVSCRFATDGDRIAFCTSPPNYTKDATTVTIVVDVVDR